MIYLIGGPAKCGKTTLTKMLSKKHGIPWVSTDTLQGVITPYIKEEEQEESFPARKQRCGSTDEKYTRYSADEIIDAYRKQAKTLFPAIDMFVLSEIKSGHDFIIEGYHIEPELVDELKKKYPRETKSAFLFKTDHKQFVKDIEKTTTPNDWIVERTRDKKIYHVIAKVICEYGKVIAGDADRFHAKAFNMDRDFDEQAKKVMKYLTSY